MNVSFEMTPNWQPQMIGKPKMNNQPQTKGQPRGVAPTNLHVRKSIRLKGYDYSQAGLYFITICTQNRLCLFGEIENGEMVLNDAGMMIKTVWHEIPVYYHKFNVREFVVMPNHIHGIIQIISNPKPVGAGPRVCPINEWQQTNRQPHKTIGQPQGVAPTMSLSDIVHRFKTLTTKRYTDGVNNNYWPRFNKKLWQRNYYEHIIRDEKSYYQISEYIQTNPLKWQNDKYYE
jgi:putative transposase